MDRYDPYFADDTDGVHFQVRVDGLLVQGYISRFTLEECYGSTARGRPCVTAYLAHRESIDEVVARRVRLEGYETVIVQSSELPGTRW